MLDNTESRKNRDELYLRVKPALSCKCNDFSKEGVEVKEFEIWNYLTIHKWKSSKGLMLCDVVNDIMHITFDEVEKYRENRKEQNLDNLEII